MRYLFLSLMLVMAGCSTNIVKPVREIRKAVAVASEKVVSAQAHGKVIGDAAAKLEFALRGQAELHAHAELIVKEIGYLQSDLSDARVSLKTSQDRVDKLEDAVSKNESERVVLARRYGRLKAIIAGLFAAAAGYFLFKFKWLLTFAGPWGLAGFVVVPGVVFGIIYFGLDRVL